MRILRTKDGVRVAITSTVFLMFFLPSALAIYYISRDSIKEYVLLAISLLFYACGSPQFLLIFIASALITVGLGRAMSGCEGRKCAKVLLVLGILWNLAMLCYYKYVDFGLSIFSQLTHTDAALRNLALPMGISFFTFKAISYLTDIYCGRAILHENPAHDMLYLSLFTQIQSGPLSRYNEMGTRWQGESGTQAKAQQISGGVYRFLIGLNKKVIAQGPPQQTLLAPTLMKLFGVPIHLYPNQCEHPEAACNKCGALCHALRMAPAGREDKGQRHA